MARQAARRARPQSTKKDRPDVANGEGLHLDRDLRDPDLSSLVNHASHVDNSGDDPEQRAQSGVTAEASTFREEEQERSLLSDFSIEELEKELAWRKKGRRKGETVVGTTAGSRGGILTSDGDAESVVCDVDARAGGRECGDRDEGLCVPCFEIA